MLTQQELKRQLHYDPITGIFTWLIHTRNTKIGQVAGYIQRGYRRIGIDEHQYPASQLACLYMTGAFPKTEMDHINRDRNDDRWENLRDVTRQFNLYNTKRKKNATGFSGVQPKRGKYSARLRINGAREHLGVFNSPKEAYRMVRIEEWRRKKNYKTPVIFWDPLVRKESL